MIITTKKEFLKVENFVKALINTEGGLPQQIFKENFSNFIFEEFDWTEGRKFWDIFIKPLGQLFNDTEIIVMIIDSDLQDYYFNLSCDPKKAGTIG